MCTGLEIGLLVGSTLLSAGGSYMQNQAQQKNAQARADARNEALKGFMDKNEQLSAEARAALEQRLNMENQAPEEAMKPLRQEREEQSSAVLGRAPTAAPIPLSGNAPKVIGQEFAKGQADTDEQSRDRAGALAGVRSFGDLLFNKGLATEGTGRDIGMVNSFAQANRRLLPIQQDLAEQSKMGVGSGLGMAGGVLGALGSMGSTVAGSGVLGGAGSVAPARSPMPRPRPVNLGL